MCGQYPRQWVRTSSVPTRRHAEGGSGPRPRRIALNGHVQENGCPWKYHWGGNGVRDDNGFYNGYDDTFGNVRYEHVVRRWREYVRIPFYDREVIVDDFVESARLQPTDDVQTRLQRKLTSV